MTMSIQEWTSTIIGVSGFLGGLLLWYRGAIEKRYAADRDFAHLRRNQEQLLQNLAVLSDEIDESKRAATEAKQRAESLAQAIAAMNQSVIELKSLNTAMAAFRREREPD